MLPNFYCHGDTISWAPPPYNMSRGRPVVPVHPASADGHTITTKPLLKQQFLQFLTFGELRIFLTFGDFP